MDNKNTLITYLRNIIVLDTHIRYSEQITEQIMEKTNSLLTDKNPRITMESQRPVKPERTHAYYARMQHSYCQIILPTIVSIYMCIKLFTSMGHAHLFGLLQFIFGAAILCGIFGGIAYCIGSLIDRYILDPMLNDREEEEIRTQEYYRYENSIKKYEVDMSHYIDRVNAAVEEYNRIYQREKAEQDKLCGYRDRLVKRRQRLRKKIQRLRMM